MFAKYENVGAKRDQRFQPGVYFCSVFSMISFLVTSAPLGLGSDSMPSDTGIDSCSHSLSPLCLRRVRPDATDLGKQG